LWVNEAPGDGSDLVEETESAFASGSIDGTSFDQELEMSVDFFR